MGRWGGRLSPSASLLRAPYGAKNGCYTLQNWFLLHFFFDVALCKQILWCTLQKNALCRASGQGIHLAIMLLLIAMCRSYHLLSLSIEFLSATIMIIIIEVILLRPLITALRRIGLHRILPLDLHVEYHKTAAIIVIILRSSLSPSSSKSSKLTSIVHEII